MESRHLLRRGIATLLACVVAGSVAGQPHEESATNLKVLPKDISHDDLIKIMVGFTRGLGVRCTYCHVGEEGKPVRPEDFSKDDKPTKLKARVMMRMVQDLNDKYLSTLDNRAKPPINVQCATCHRGVPQPRMLQDVLKIAYDAGGMDSTVSRYRALRDRYYGQSAYDFGEVPLTALAGQVRSGGHPADAIQLLALNVEMNPKSDFAKRQHSVIGVTTAFEQAGIDSGTAAYRDFKDRYGPAVVTEDVMNEVGYRLLGENKPELAVAAFALNVAAFPTSTNAYESLGEGYEKQGNRKKAIESYTKSVSLDPTNIEAKHKLDDLGAAPKKKAKPSG